MNCGIETYKDIAEVASYIITSFSLIGILISYVFSIKQIHFTTMEKCINDFRNFLAQKDSLKPIFSVQYVDLVNEEFFYIENKYLPIDVAIEWVDGMIDYLPFFDKKGQLLNDRNWDTLDYAQTIRILNNYPRVFKSLQLTVDIDFDSVYLDVINDADRQKRKDERDKLIYEIIVKLKVSWRTRWNLKRNISCR